MTGREARGSTATVARQISLTRKRSSTDTMMEGTRRLARLVRWSDTREKKKKKKKEREREREEAVKKE